MLQRKSKVIKKYSRTIKMSHISEFWEKKNNLNTTALLGTGNNTKLHATISWNMESYVKV